MRKYRPLTTENVVDISRYIPKTNSDKMEKLVSNSI